MQAVQSVATCEPWGSRSNTTQARTGSTPQPKSPYPPATLHDAEIESPMRHRSDPHRTSNISAGSEHSMQYSFHSDSDRPIASRVSRESVPSSVPTIRSSFALERRTSTSQLPLEMLSSSSKSSRNAKVSTAVLKLLSNLPEPLKEYSRIFAVLSHHSLVPLVV